MTLGMIGKVGIGIAAGVALLCSHGIARAGSFQAWNNCWEDFDAGGGWWCGLRSRACATAGPTDNHRIHCSATNSGSNIPAAYLGSQVPSKLVALDSIGYVFFVDNTNKIWFEKNGAWVKFGVQPPIACIQKLVAAGDAGAGTTTLFALGCGASAGQAHRFLNGAWTGIDGNVQDISVGVWGSNAQDAFALLQSTGERPLWISFSQGTGNFRLAEAKGTATETWTSAGVTYQQKHWPDKIGGRTAFFGNLTACPRINAPPIGQWQFYGYRVPIGMGPGGPYSAEAGSNCATLQVPPGSTAGNDAKAWITKVVNGNRGPGGGEAFWILTNVTRVFAYR